MRAAMNKTLLALVASGLGFQADAQEAVSYGRGSVASQEQSFAYSRSVSLARPGSAPQLWAAADDTGGVGGQAAPTTDGGHKAVPVFRRSDVKISGHLNAGVTGNVTGSSDNDNFGQLFTDKDGDPLLNQALITVEKTLDPKAIDCKCYNLGFKVQAFYGSDARYTHSVGQLDKTLDSRHQVDVIEAYVNTHLPWITERGIDVKLGQYVTPLGYEVFDAKGNFFYSHSYLIYFGVPLRHTGVLATTHLTEHFDLLTGLDTGANTSFGGGDNNDAYGILGGFAYTKGSVFAQASTHVGPELPEGTPGVHPNSDLRYYNDFFVQWKVNDQLTSVTDLNYVRDDGLDASGGGAEQMLTYSINERWGVGARAEVWRDVNGAFVAAFPENLGLARALRGEPTEVIGGGSTTYGALTLGVNYKPPVPGVEGFVIRPEIRFDQSLNGTTPYDGGTDDNQLTIGGDVVLPF
jgi:hypothetical protein